MDSSMANVVSSQTPFGLYSSFKGSNVATKGAVKVVSSKGIVYADRSEITRGSDLIGKYKVTFSKATTEHGGQASKAGSRQVLSSIKVLEPNCVCTQSYLMAGVFDDQKSANNLADYLRTRFVRFLLLQAITSQDLSRDKFCFVPAQPFDQSWTDGKLYKKYHFTIEEIALIESMVRSIENGGAE
jgi:site-specific DNA-methyltransferase (adenine-specific)